MSYILLASGVGVSAAVTINSSNAIIQAKQTKTASSNAAILNEAIKTTSSNAVIALTHTVTTSTNAVIRATQQKFVDTNAVIFNQRRFTSANACIASKRTKTASTNAIVKGGVQLTASANAVIKATFKKTPSSSAVIVGGGSLIPSNAVIANARTKTTSASAVINAQAVTPLSNAVIATHTNLTVSTNGIVLVRQTKTASSNAIINNSGTTTHTDTANTNAVIAVVITRGAISDITMFAEYLRIIGILMLVDPSFQTELNTVPSQQTFTFVKKVVKGLFYVDIAGGGGSLTCQVKTGDGINYGHVVNVSVRLLSDTVASATVTGGTILAGAGTQEMWVQTDVAGAFTLQLVGAGTVLVEITPKQGVIMSQDLTI
jgi:hypothetical protein